MNAFERNFILSALKDLSALLFIYYTQHNFLQENVSSLKNGLTAPLKDNDNEKILRLFTALPNFWIHS